MERERDLFRAIVIAGLAIASGCSSPSTEDDAGRDGAVLADAGEDAGPEDAGDFDAGEDAMVLIL